MEFDDMKKIWDTQTNEPLYVLNEAALHNRIRAKKRKARSISNVSELMAIVVNTGAGVFLMIDNMYKTTPNLYLYLLAAWMLFTAAYCVILRARRMRSNLKFDRSVLGDLDVAIATAGYQVRLSDLLRWNIIPTAMLIILALWSADKSIGLIIAFVIFFAITWYASGWEHNYYKRRKGELEQLRSLLTF